jgi:hypothetical protein
MDPAQSDALIVATRLSEIIGMPVHIHIRRQGGGTLTISFKDLPSLESILLKFGV